MGLLQSRVIGEVLAPVALLSVIALSISKNYYLPLERPVHLTPQTPRM